MDFDSWFRAILTYRDQNFLGMPLSQKMALASELGTGEVLLKRYLANENLQHDAKNALTLVGLLRTSMGGDDSKEARAHVKELITMCARIKATINIMRRRENESEAAES